MTRVQRAQVGDALAQASSSGAEDIADTAQSLSRSKGGLVRLVRGVDTLAIWDAVAKRGVTGDQADFSLANFSSHTEGTNYCNSE